MTIYFVAGGLLGSAWVNSLQLVVMLGGFLFALPVVLVMQEDSRGERSAGAPPSSPISLTLRARDPGWMFLVLTAPSFLISPGLIQKAYGARSESALKIGIGLNALVLMSFAFVPVIFGMAARGAVPGIENPNDVLPAFLMTALPPWLGALALSAVFSTEVDTCDTILFMLSTSISKDVYKRHLNPSASDAQLLRVARLRPAGGARRRGALARGRDGARGSHDLLSGDGRDVLRADRRRALREGDGYARAPRPRSPRACWACSPPDLHHAGVPLGGPGPGWRVRRVPRLARVVFKFRAFRSAGSRLDRTSSELT